MAQREERLQRDRERRCERRAAETPSEREERLQRDRERSHAKRAAESTEEREARLRRERDRRAAETPEQREVHECQSVEPSADDVAVRDRHGRTLRTRILQCTSLRWVETHNSDALLSIAHSSVKITHA